MEIDLKRGVNDMKCSNCEDLEICGKIEKLVGKCHPEDHSENTFGYIYLIICMKNGKVYIGKTISQQVTKNRRSRNWTSQDRFSQHVNKGRQLKLKQQRNPEKIINAERFIRKIAKHGTDSFYFTVLDTLETHGIDLYDPYFWREKGENYKQAMKQLLQLEDHYINHYESTNQKNGYNTRKAKA